MPKETIEATLAFVDLAGFTALTETHGDEAAADLAADVSRDAATPRLVSRAYQLSALVRGSS